MRTPVTKEKLSSHMTYHWWKYLLIVLLSVFGWNLIYTMTAYRPPDSKIADVTCECFTSDSQEAIDNWLANVNATEIPEMEQMKSIMITSDSYYGSMQFSVYMATNTSCVYIMTADHFQSYAANGYFLALDDCQAICEAAQDAGISLDKGYRTETETYERHLYGIPLSQLPGFETLGVASDDTYMAISASAVNPDALEHLIAIMIRDLHE